MWHICPVGSWQNLLRLLEVEARWDSIGEPCRTKGGKFVMRCAAYKGKSFKGSLNTLSFISQGTAGFKPKENLGED